MDKGPVSQRAGFCSRSCSSGGGRAEEGGRGPGRGAGEGPGACVCTCVWSSILSPDSRNGPLLSKPCGNMTHSARWERCAPVGRAFGTLRSLVPVGDSCPWLLGVVKGRALKGTTSSSSSSLLAFLLCWAISSSPCIARLSVSLDCVYGVS